MFMKVKKLNVNKPKVNSDPRIHIQVMLNEHFKILNRECIYVKTKIQKFKYYTNSIEILYYKK